MEQTAEKEFELNSKLIDRGFPRKTLLNNRGLIGAIVEELQAKHEEEIKQANWISIEDDIPKSIGSYLIFYIEDWEDSTPKAMAWAFYNSNSEWCIDNQKLNHVTHWMPLPEPPTPVHK